ncbi:MAG: translation initiation factor IF-2 [Bacteroidetes bacterium GWF2_38_335]|nr:MAG: translation initiation factor IF-2 [Bacteroidetes bacterium GWF2_38_335]OFY81598.1 MAG: translation initiation factor IF-2 [Bacteroidetes bacterium RIFOXYA12_FULL_38_20]HBS88947.1 translation initiation factor IF-2 [Bacteroidales bacterium]
MTKGTIRLSKAAKELNVGISTIIDFLNKKGIDIGESPNPNSKISDDVFNILVKEYSSELKVKKESEKLDLKKTREKKETISIDDEILPGSDGDEDDEDDEDEDEDIDYSQEKRRPAEVTNIPIEKTGPKILGKIDLSPKKKIVEPVAEVVEPIAEPEPKKVDAKAETKKPETKKAAKKTEEIVEAPVVIAKEAESEVKVVGKIDLDSLNQKTRPSRKSKEEKDKERQEKTKVKSAPAEVEPVIEEIPEVPKVPELKVEKPDVDFIHMRIEKLTGPTVVGRIDLPVVAEKENKGSSDDNDFRKKKRKRIKKEKAKVEFSPPEKEKEHRPVTPASQTNSAQGKKSKKKKKAHKPEVSEVEVQQQIKDTLARLTTKTKSKGAKYRREKRDSASLKMAEEQEKIDFEKNIIKVAEFVSVSELATMMNVPVNDVITTCMNMGLFVSINQRLDAETMSVVADEFGHKVEFTSVDIEDSLLEEVDDEEDLVHRPPIVTVMGHVDHGKTKLLDYIRSANVVAGEAGGITQHIGAYGVKLKDGRQITFLDTPGHEAFTAMRARGAKVTDIAIIVVAADDSVMPQTIEAINHAQAANVPIVFAINKIDKPTANPERIKEQLANMNYLVEDWGGKYQSQEIAAKPGTNVELLLEKVLLEAEILDLKANPDRNARGTVIESSLDKGRGYVATLLVETGTMRVGDIMLAGCYTGHVKAMFNERGGIIEEAGPSTPVRILGLNGAPQAGDKFNILDSDREAKEIATKRIQLQREQGLRTQKHITLDEIGRRIAIGNFQELNVIVKGDVDGSIEALADSIIKLSTPEIQVNVIHKAVGAITEMDVTLAAASNAVILGFQVRPSLSARKLAEKEQIEIRLYSIIYDAINDIRDAMEGMLSPDIKEEIVATVEVREVFKITKVGTVAGCFVRDGKITRNTQVRIIRDGIVVYTGELGSLKRFKDDVKEVTTGYECGLNIHNFNDIKTGDIIEGYEQVEVKKTL